MRGGAQRCIGAPCSSMRCRVHPLPSPAAPAVPLCDLHIVIGVTQQLILPRRHPTERLKEVSGSDYHIAVAEGEALPRSGHAPLMRCCHTRLSPPAATAAAHRQQACRVQADDTSAQRSTHAERPQQHRSSTPTSTRNRLTTADKANGKLVGTAALIIERKFIHECGKVGGWALLCEGMCLCVGAGEEAHEQDPHQLYPHTAPHS